MLMCDDGWALSRVSCHVIVRRCSGAVESSNCTTITGRCHVMLMCDDGQELSSHVNVRRWPGAVESCQCATIFGSCRVILMCDYDR